MSHRTKFAGLAAPDLGEAPAQVLNGDFIYRNPDLIDQFLRLGAISHRHDGHQALPNPVSAPVLTLQTGGSLDPSTEYFVGYTMVDTFGGETTISFPVNVTTDDVIGNPTIAPSATVVTSAGIMPDGNYAYTLTYTDGAGGETTIGPIIWVYVPPGFPSASVVLSGLATELAPNGDASTWRLWRSYEGDDWHLVTEGTSNTFVDDGFDPPDNPALPPEVSTANLGLQSAILVTLPDSIAEPGFASAVAVNIYLSLDEGFSNPSLYAQLPMASAIGSGLVINQFVTNSGSPPAVSTALAGANKINPDTDMLDFPWKRPVATIAQLNALPKSGNASGDARIVANPLALVVWNAQRQIWEAVAAASGISAGGGGGGGSPGSGFVVSDGSTTVNPNIREILFAGSGEVTTTVTDLGGGSAKVTVSAPADSGGGGAGTITVEDDFGGTATEGTLLLEGITGTKVSVHDFPGFFGQVLLDTPPWIASASGSVAQRVAGQNADVGTVTFLGSGGTTVTMSEIGGSALIKFYSPPSAAGGSQGPQGPAGPTGPQGPTGNNATIAASAASVLVNPARELLFAASGGLGATLIDQGGGSALVMIAPSSTAAGGPQGPVGPQGPQGPQGPAGTGGAGGTANIAASAASVLVNPVSELLFTGSGGLGATLVNQGGGSALVIIAPSSTAAGGPQGPVGPQGPQGPQGPAGTGSTGGQVPIAAASAGASAVNPDYYTEYAASGIGLGASVQNLGGGSARVLFGVAPVVPKSTQASGYVLQPSDLGTVIESASASTSVGYLIPRNADVPMPPDAVVEFFQYGTGQVQIVAASANVLLRSDGNRTRIAGQFGTVGARQRAIDEWVLTGDLI